MGLYEALELDHIPIDEVPESVTDDLFVIDGSTISKYCLMPSPDRRKMPEPEPNIRLRR